MSDNLPDELLIDTIATYESVTQDSAMLDFAYQLSTARFLGQFCKTESELAYVHGLIDHPLPHMRRLGSLAFCFLPFCWYEKTLPLVQKNLSDSLKWIRYDSIRFFFFHACIDESVVELLNQYDTGGDADITKAVSAAQAVISELRTSYALPFHRVQLGDIQVDVPQNWLVEKDRHLDVLKSPALPALRLHEQSLQSSLRLFVIDNLTAEDLRDMPLFNMEAKLDDATLIIPPAHITPQRYRATYTTGTDHRGTTELTTTEFIAWDESRLLVANLLSPLMHQQWVLDRNLRILDSIKRV